MSTENLAPDLATLAEERERYRLIAENASDVVVQARADGTISWVSPAVTRVLGWQPDQLVGHRVKDFIHADDVPAIANAQGRIAHGETLNFEARVRTAAGTYRWVASRVRPIVDDSGAVTARVAAWRDIEAEHAAREALLASEEQYRLLAENASDIVYQSGRDRLIRWIAPSVERVLGWTPEELVGTDFNDLVYPDDQRIVEPDRERVYAGDSLQAPGARYTLRVRTKDDRYVWFSCVGTPLRDAHGGPAGLIGGLKLVEDLVAARERGTYEAERRQAILDSLLDPHVLLQAVRDDSGAIVDFAYADANDAACEYNHVPREQLVGARLLDQMPGQAGSEIVALSAAAMESGQPLVLHDYALLPEILGSERRYDIRAVVVGDALSFTWRDVTDRYISSQRIAESQELLRVNMDAVQDPLVLLLAQRHPISGGIVDFRYLDVNEAGCAYLSMPREDLIGKGLLELSPGVAGSGLLSLYVAATESNEPTAVDDFLYDNELLGLSRYYDIRARCVSGDRLSLTWRDVTDRHEAVEQLAASEERFRLLAENSTDVVLLARDGIMQWLSPALTGALGWQPEQWVGHRFEEFTHPNDVLLAQQRRAEINEGASRVTTLRMRDMGGDYHWVEIHAGPFTNAHGERDGIVATFRVVDSEVAAQEELEHLARFDTLTGALNRKEILHKLSGMSAGARRPGQRTAVLFCDIDRFKEINDAHGHAAGDQVLRTLTERLGAAVRDEDYVARIGGDELLVILTAVHGLDDALAVAEKIREAASAPIGFEGAHVSTSLSIGVSLMETGESVDSIVARADQAMYEAKAAGRNQVVAIDSTTQELPRRFP